MPRELIPLVVLACGVLAACPGRTPPEPAPAPAPAGDQSVEAEAPEPADAAPAPAEKPHCSRELVTLAARGKLEEVRALLEREGCDGHAEREGGTALMRAAERGHLEVVRALIRAGAEVDDQLESSVAVGRTEVGKTALWFAVAEEHPEIVEALLRAGADPNLHPPEGLPLLVLAALHESPEIAKLLVEAGVDRDAVAPRSGATAMTYSDGPSAPVFEYLTSVGVEPEGLSDRQIESLRWEAENRPGEEASAEERAAFFAEVLERSYSRTACELAVKHLRELRGEAEIVVPALLGAVTESREDFDYGWSRIYAARALQSFSWTGALDAALPTLLEMILRDDSQQVRIAVTELVAKNGPVRRAVLRALRKKMRRGPERFWGAKGLGMLLARAGPEQRGLVRRGKRALRRAMRGKKGTDAGCSTIAACAEAQLYDEAKKALEGLAD